jgi:hypothetical protein
MKRIILVVLTLILALATTTIACINSSPTPTPGKPGSGAVINSDSVVRVKIQSISKQSTGYSWKLDVLIQDSQEVGTLPNPVKDSVNKVVAVVTDQDMTAFKTNDVVKAKIKYVGDVNIASGISLYLYNVALN